MTIFQNQGIYVVQFSGLQRQHSSSLQRRTHQTRYSVGSSGKPERERDRERKMIGNSGYGSSSYVSSLPPCPPVIGGSSAIPDCSVAVPLVADIPAPGPFSGPSSHSHRSGTLLDDTITC